MNVYTIQANSNEGNQMSSTGDVAKSDDRVSERIAGRLRNWKFESAARLSLALRPNHAHTPLIVALSATYGNCGHFDGSAGTIVAGALQSMGVEDVAHLETGR